MDIPAPDEPTLLSRPVRTPTGQTIDTYTPQDGDHLCSLWTDPERDRDAAREFFRGSPDGAALWIQDLSRGGSPSPPARAGLLSGHGDEAAEFPAYSTRDVYLTDGTFNPQRLYQFWGDRIGEMAGRGARRLRIVAEMGWTLEGRPGTEHAATYESGLNRVLSESPVSVICQYGSTRFRPQAVLAMLLSHPRVIIGRRVFTNPFHVADDGFPAVMEQLSADPVGSLMPMWRYYLHRLPSLSEMGAFLCNSIPSFIAAESITVQIAGQPHGWHLDTDGDVLREIEPDGTGSRATGHLFAFWPSGTEGMGGSVHAGAHGGMSWVEVSFGGHARCVLLSRPRRFERSELMVFTTLASGIASTLPGASRFA